MIGRMFSRVEYKYTVKALGKDVFQAHRNLQTVAKALTPYNFKILKDAEIVQGAELRIQTTILGQRFDWLIQVNEAQEGKLISYKVVAVERPWLTLRITETFQQKLDEVEVRYLVEYDAPLLLTYLVKKVLIYILQAKEASVKERVKQLTAEVKEKVPLTYPLHLFNLLQIIGLILASAVLIAAASLTPPLSYLLALVSWVLYWFASHCLAHYIVGTLLGIRFSHYFIGLSNLYRLNIGLPQQLKLMLFTLGIKTEGGSFYTASPRAKAAMYAAGAVASIAVPFTTPFYLIYKGVFNEGLLFLLLSLLNTSFSLYFSFKAGDLWKAKRALKREGFSVLLRSLG